MLKHCVFLNFRPVYSGAEREAVLETLAGLTGEVPGLISVDYGTNLDFENKSVDYSHGFIATFTNREAHLAYETHPDHIRAGGRLVEMCVGGHQGIIVFDLEV